MPSPIKIPSHGTTVTQDVQWLQNNENIQKNIKTQTHMYVKHIKNVFDLSIIMLKKLIIILISLPLWSNA